MEKITAPWTPEQVEALNAYQHSRRFHPFTCGTEDRSDAPHTKAKEERGDPDYGLLIATPEGWRCPACTYTQNWAWEFMAKPVAPFP